jgi:hypothetical protein
MNPNLGPVCREETLDAEAERDAGMCFNCQAEAAREPEPVNVFALHTRPVFRLLKVTA